MAIYKGYDKIIQMDILENNSKIDIQNELSGLEMELYDSLGDLIQQFSWPTQGGYTDIEVSGSTATIRIFSTNLADRALGSVKYIGITRKTDTDFPDNSYDAVYPIENFDQIKNA